MLSAFTVGKYFAMDKVHDVEDKLLNQTEKFLDEVDKIDGRMSTVWNLWKFRMGRIFTPILYPILRVSSLFVLVSYK